MKIIIGITQDQTKIEELLSQYRGRNGSLTEVGPFDSKINALNWLAYLKSRIGEFEEIIPEQQSGKEAIWYGFTFEQAGKG